MTDDEPPPPFRVGDQLVRGTAKKYHAVVTKVELLPHGSWFVTIRRRSNYSGGSDYRAWFVVRPAGPDEGWRLATAADVSLDETARLLARAVLDGDTSAALALADRVMELCGSVVRNPN